MQSAEWKLFRSNRNILTVLSYNYNIEDFIWRNDMKGIGDCLSTSLYRMKCKNPCVRELHKRMCTVSKELNKNRCVKDRICK